MGEPNIGLTLSRIVDLSHQRSQLDQELAGAVGAEAGRLCTELRKRRDELGLTQEQVASAIGLSRAQVANIEGGRGVSLESLIGFAAVLGLCLNFTTTTTPFVEPSDG